MTALQVENLSKRYGKNLILDNLSFSLQTGSLSALLGPNGSGKSTLMKGILGIIKTSSATIIKRNPRIGYMPQTPAFPSYLSVAEIIQFFNELQRVSNKQEASLHKKTTSAESLRSDQEKWQEQLIYEMNINTFMDKKINQISPGMRQKVNIMQCFMFPQDLFFLDEPSAGLDLRMLHYLRNLLLAQKKAGKTILYTSHIMNEVEILANEMILLFNKKIALQASPQEIIQQEKAINLEEALRFWLEKRDDIENL